MSRLPIISCRFKDFNKSLLLPIIGFLPFMLTAQRAGIGTTAPEAGLHVLSNDGLLINGESGQGTLPFSGYGTRMMFFPKTGSFRSGIISSEDGGIYADWWGFSNTGDYSFATGINVKANGFASAAFGQKTQALGTHSFASGELNIASGGRSFVTGFENTAPSFGEAVVGVFASEYIPVGGNYFDAADRIFVVGNGTGSGSLRHNALTILKNGNTGIGTETPASLLDVAGTATANDIVAEDSLRTVHLRVTHGAAFGYILKSNTIGDATWADPASLVDDFWDISTTDAIYNTNPSNVGIGLINPSQKLHVKGNIGIDEGRLTFLHTGGSVFIGMDAGANDDLDENNNVCIGHEAGLSNVTGQRNLALGRSALLNAVAENDNIAIGYNAMSSLTSGGGNVVIGNFGFDIHQSGSDNVIVGHEALGNATSGDFNTVIGNRAMGNASGNNNLALGNKAGYQASGDMNIFIGTESGYNASGDHKLYIDNTSTSTPLIFGDFSTNKVIIHDSLATKYLQITSNVAEGKTLKCDAFGTGTWVQPHLLFEDTLSVNFFIGSGAGGSVTTATDNTIIGAYAGEHLISGYENTGLGKWSLQHLTTAYGNTAFGHNTLNAITNGNNNTAMGWSALAGATGSSNVALGTAAGGENNAGSQNVYIGNEAGMNNSGSGNVFLGHKAGREEAGSNQLFIDNSNTSTPLIHGNFATNEVTINDSLSVGKELSVGTNVAKSTFEVNGSVATKFKTPLEAGVTQPDASGMVWRYTTGTGNITLPGASTCPNRIYVIINQTGAVRTISTYRDLATNNQSTLSSSVALWLMSDGAEWWQIK